MCVYVWGSVNSTKTQVWPVFNMKKKKLLIVAFRKIHVWTLSTTTPKSHFVNFQKDIEEHQHNRYIKKKVSDMCL